MPTTSRAVTGRPLDRPALWSLTVGTAMALMMLVGRVWFTQSSGYHWLPWNLLLAWLPLAWSSTVVTLAIRHPRQSWRLWLPAGLWLVFLPNAPYIVTDFIHLLTTRSPIVWYDIGMLATFAWTGFLLGILSLRQMHRLVAQHWGTVVGWLFVLVVTGLSGLGVYLGRFERWNSWDLVLHPWAVLNDVVAAVIDPRNHQRQIGVTLMFAAVLLVGYVTVPPHGQSEEA